MSGRCLDVGSGPGDTVVDFILPKLNTNASLVCSDISESMVTFGEEKYKDNRRLSFFKLDIESPNLPEDLVAQFDHVLSTYCLHWCQDMHQVFENIFNLLRPGGTALLVFVADFPALNVYKEMAAIPRYQPYMKDANLHIPVFQQSVQPRQDLKSLIINAGFKVRHCSIREKSYMFDNVDDFSKFLEAINPFIRRVPANLVDEYRRDLTRRFVERNIIFTKNNRDRDDYSVLCLYRTFVVYIKKPATEL